MAAPVPLMLIAGATQAIGAIVAGNAQAAQYNAQAQAAAYNANIQRQQSSAVAQQTSAREDLQRRQARQIIGRQVAAGAESGVNITTGSASDLLRQSLYDAEMDALNIRYEGEINRVGLLNQAALKPIWLIGVPIAWVSVVWIAVRLGLSTGTSPRMAFTIAEVSGVVGEACVNQSLSEPATAPAALATVLASVAVPADGGLSG